MTKCNECCEEIDHQRYTGDTAKTMRDEGVCFSCAFWLELVERDKTNDQSLIIDGVHYVWKNDYAGMDRRYAGHAGAEFKIRFFDYREDLVTHNLWCQGKIPSHFTERMPNTAEFIRE